MGSSSSVVEPEKKLLSSGLERLVVDLLSSSGFFGVVSLSFFAARGNLSVVSAVAC